MGLLHLRSTNINQAPMPAVLQVKNFGAEKLLCPRQQLFAMSHSFMTVTRSSTIGFSGTVTGLSAHFTAGSSQLMHWRSVRPDYREHSFSAFRAARCPIHWILRFARLTRNSNFCSIGCVPRSPLDVQHGPAPRSRSTRGNVRLPFAP